MMAIAYTLVADGSSDRALVPIIDWILLQHSDRPIQSSFCSPSEVRASTLAERVERAVSLFPCDILFVHRDAEHPGRVDQRRNEIEAAVRGASAASVSVIPVRMTEAWLLIFESAIRRAADNPNGDVRLDLPNARDVERIVDPKEAIFTKLKLASGLPPNRLRKFDVRRARSRVSELVETFESLRAVPSFAAFERDVQRAIRIAQLPG